MRRTSAKMVNCNLSRNKGDVVVRVYTRYRQGACQDFFGMREMGSRMRMGFLIDWATKRL